MVTPPPEKMGSFYLGAKYDVATQSILSEAINYDARDLTTHAVCVGMTGSGKTGLCIGLLEEAALDKVPAIIIDPKGDMTNLLLQFPALQASDFKPWINADDAGRKNMSVDGYAAGMASKWKEGLASWGQDTTRLTRLKAAVDYTIFTPGSDSGIPINIMGSFAAPKVDFDSDAEMLLERIQGTVAALLGMIGSKADPVRSREGILLANIFEHNWRAQKDLDLATLIKSIQTPPMQQLGVFDVETFFPAKDRFELAMDFNTLIASPQFKYWLQGEDLDIDKIYFTPEGKPRHSIFYIAHLSDSERMFFVTLLLNSLITWMRRQSGTTSLRSLLYFDEIFGYFPPTANPPSKQPLLTLLKQARAYGVGSVLVTQNPVDIDYKGLSNAGTWFIGKLQTERDKLRVLEGLNGAIAEAGGQQLDFDKIITGLSSRVFLMHNVHEAAPVVYHTRWAMSYLRGPMTRPQLKALMKDKKAQGSAAVYNSSIAEVQASKQQLDSQPQVTMPPTLDHKIPQKFFAVWKSAGEVGLAHDNDKTIIYEPQLLLSAQVRFYDEKRRVDLVKDMTYLSSAPDAFGRVSWENAIKISNYKRSLLSAPDHPDNVGVEYRPVPDSMDTTKELSGVEKDFSDWLYQTQRFFSLEHTKLKMYQSDDETEEAFRMRLQTRAKEERDQELDALHDKYDAKFSKLEQKIRKEERDLDEAQAERSSRRNDEFLNVVETVFGGVFGGRRRRSASSVSTKRRMARKAAEKVRESEEDLEMLDQAKRELENELHYKIEDISHKWESVEKDLIKKEITPRRTDVKVIDPIIVWYPYWVSGGGVRHSALE
jgi:hypothetical protein